MDLCLVASSPSSLWAWLSCLAVLSCLAEIRRRFRRWRPNRLKYRRTEPASELPNFRQTPDEFFAVDGPTVRLQKDLWTANAAGMQFSSPDKSAVELQLDCYENERRGGACSC